MGEKAKSTHPFFALFSFWWEGTPSNAQRLLSGSTLRNHTWWAWGPYGNPGIKIRLVVSKANVLPSILLLQPLLFFLVSALAMNTLSSHCLWNRNCGMPFIFVDSEIYLNKTVNSWSLGMEMFSSQHMEQCVCFYPVHKVVMVKYKGVQLAPFHTWVICYKNPISFYISLRKRMSFPVSKQMLTPWWVKDDMEHDINQSTFVIQLWEMAPSLICLMSPYETVGPHSMSIFAWNGLFDVFFF